MSIDPSNKPIYTLNQLLRDLESGRQFLPDNLLMPGIDRLEVLCDKAFQGTGFTIANVRQIRADLCDEIRCSSKVAGDFTLHEVVNMLKGSSSLPISWMSPIITWDTICDLNLDIHRADCRIVKGTDPSVCPKADPPLPAEYLPIVVKIFEEFKQIPAGHTIHWIGLEAWRRNLCDCSPLKASEVGTCRDQGGAGQVEGKKAPPRRGRKPETDPKEDNRIVDAWGAGQNYKTYEECGHALGKTGKQVKDAIDRHRHRVPKRSNRRKPPE